MWGELADLNMEGYSTADRETEQGRTEEKKDEESCLQSFYIEQIFYFILFISPLFNQVDKLRTSSHLQ